MDINELVRYIAKPLVDFPDDVLVTEIKVSRITILEYHESQINSCAVQISICYVLPLSRWNIEEEWLTTKPCGHTISFYVASGLVIRFENLYLYRTEFPRPKIKSYDFVPSRPFIDPPIFQIVRAVKCISC